MRRRVAVKYLIGSVCVVCAWVTCAATGPFDGKWNAEVVRRGSTDRNDGVVMRVAHVVIAIITKGHTESRFTLPTVPSDIHDAAPPGSERPRRGGPDGFDACLTAPACRAARRERPDRDCRVVDPG